MDDLEYIKEQVKKIDLSIDLLEKIADVVLKDVDNLETYTNDDFPPEKTVLALINEKNGISLSHLKEKLRVYGYTENAVWWVVKGLLKRGLIYEYVSGSVRVVPTGNFDEKDGVVTLK